MERETLNPTAVLKDAGVDQHSVIADFGCGPGIFSLAAAALTKETVYCYDVLPTALETVASRARTMHIVNTELKRVNLELPGSTGLADGSVSLVIMRKILCQRQDNSKLFEEAARILSPDGRVLVVGWTAEATVGPHPSERISREAVGDVAATAGFTLADDRPSDAQHYIVTFSRTT